MDITVDELRANLRAQLERPVLVGACCAVLFLIAGIVVFRSFRKPLLPHPTGRYFANEATGELVLEPLNSTPPLTDGAGSPSLVAAAVFSTDGGATKTAAYYEKYTPEAKKALETMSSPAAVQDAQIHGLLVRLPAAGSPWVLANTKEGASIMASVPTGPKVTECSVAN